MVLGSQLSYLPYIDNELLKVVGEGFIFDKELKTSVSITIEKVAKSTDKIFYIFLKDDNTVKTGECRVKLGMVVFGCVSKMDSWSFSPPSTTQDKIFFKDLREKVVVGEDSIFIDTIYSYGRLTYNGIGRALIQSVVEYGRRKKCFKIFVKAVTGSQGFYYKLLFRSASRDQKLKVMQDEEIEKAIDESSTTLEPCCSTVLPLWMQVSLSGKDGLSKKEEISPILFKKKNNLQF